ncbi:MAG: hypothetical protein HKN82_14665 [Akkermansiaceae bacterium]|nr:hypothetical protein [Akkermansiaceae bacterium]NNM29637.1 hypothetical protein [Akkermansiaceae bacterium]
MAGLRHFLDELFSAGPVPFERFMHEALYHPEFGYYAAHVPAIGPRGDFATSASLAPVLGTAVARWIEAEWAALPEAPAVHLVEAGPGDGHLMRRILTALPGRLRRRLRVHLAEISPRLEEAQRESLARHRKRITWHRGMDAVMEHINRTAPGPALVVSNELVDAFPVRVFRPARTGGPAPPPDELHLTYGDDLLSEAWLPARDVPDSTAFTAGFPAGQRLEVHDSYRRSLQSWVPRLGAGAILTIDYGGPVEDLYDRRPNGSLRAYFRHQRFEGAGLYARFGRQDLTADVNFSDLAAWGDGLGLETVSLCSQGEFLRRHASPKAGVEAYLADPRGPGEAFRVLHQRKR